MRKLLLIMFLPFIFSIKSFCQDYNNVYIGAGLSFPESPTEFSDYYKMGFNVGGGVGFALSPTFAIVGDFSYHNFSFDDSNFLSSFGLNNLGINISGGATSVYTITGNLKVSLNQGPGVVVPYLIGGVGYVNLSTSDVMVSGNGSAVSVPGNSESDFYAQVGAGVDFLVAPTTGIFVEGKYAIAFTSGSNTAFLPIRVGVIFGI